MNKVLKYINLFIVVIVLFINIRYLTQTLFGNTSIPLPDFYFGLIPINPLYITLVLLIISCIFSAIILYRHSQRHKNKKELLNIFCISFALVLAMLLTYRTASGFDEMQSFKEFMATDSNDLIVWSFISLLVLDVYLNVMICLKRTKYNI